MENDDKNLKLAQKFKMYHLVEKHLKLAAENNEPITPYWLRQKDEIKDNEASPYEVTNIIRAFIDKNMVKWIGVGHERAYWWNPEVKGLMFTESGRFIKPVLDNKIPEEPVEESRVQQSVNAKDIELVINGTTIIVGKNPETGRVRITIEG